MLYSLTYSLCSDVFVARCSSGDLSSCSAESDSVVDADFNDAEHDPEAWSVTVDKATLKTLSARDIKRQDHIWGNYWTCTNLIKVDLL